MKFLLVFIFIIFYGILSLAQNQISGNVYDRQTGETLIGATITDLSTQATAITNKYGHFSLKVSEPDTFINLIVSHLGYKQLEIQVEKSNSIKIQLQPKEFEIEEVLVQDNDVIKNQTKNGLYKLLPQNLKQMPAFSGEADLTTFLQLVPGVAIAGDGDASMNVRGGSNEQNLFLIDDLPLYYVNHLGGFLSTFNSDIIKSTDFYKSGFPAKYGDRLSSVVDVRTNDGNLNSFDVYGTVGLISSKIGIDGPIIKNKSSFLASFRKNTIPFFRWLYDLNVDFKFYDANLKFNYILSPKDRIFFSFYNGNDNVGISNKIEKNSNKQSVSWGNIAGSLRYNRIISSKLYSNLILGNTTYRYNELTYSRQNIDNIIQIFNNEFQSSISDNFVKINFDYFLLEKVQLSAGYKFTHHNYVPGKSKVIKSNESSEIKTFSYPESTSGEHNLYLQADINNISGFDFNAGLRTSLLFSNQNSYFLPEPRLMVSKKLGKKIKLSTAYDVMHQTFHLLTNQGAGVPVEYRIPVLSFAPPEKSNQYSLGISYFPEIKDIQISVDFYSKQLSNLVTLKDGINYAFSYKDWENIIWHNGKGKSKGIELLIRKPSGKTTGWIGATFAKSERKFEELNNGNYFPYKYDRPFEFKYFLSHRINKRIEANATWVYGAGTPLSIPTGQYYDLEGEVILIFGERNGVRGEPYHRMDVGVTYKLYPKWGESEWNFSIINLYNRKNPYYY
ncbi:MAG: TonB-dependent receptor, partial [Bacteroidales bacterium]